MDIQKITLTLYNEPTDYKCVNSRLAVKEDMLTADGRKYIIKDFKGISSEALFRLVSDLINVEIDKRVENKK